MARSTIVVNQGPHTLSKQFRDTAGTVSDPGTVTIGITDANGDTVVAAGTATSGTGTSPRTYSLAVQTQVNVLFVTWTDVTTTATILDVVEVVGSVLFDEAEARAFDNADGSTGALSSATVYPDAAIAAERDRVTDLLEQWTGRSWITRYCRIVAPGPSGHRLKLSAGHRRASNGYPVGGPGFTFGVQSLIRVDDGVAVSGATFDPTTGEVIRTDASWTKHTTQSPFNVTVEYVYGEPWPVDSADRIALLLVRDRLVKSKFPDSAIAVQGAEGSYQLIREGGPLNNPTRLPEVNAWIAAHRTPMVG